MADKRIYDLTEATEAGTNDMLALDNSNFAETKKIKASNFVKLLANKYDVTTVIQTGSTNTTGGTITKGTFFYLNGDLCVAIADIASGATFTFETNYTYAEIGQEIASLKSDLSPKRVKLTPAQALVYASNDLYAYQSGNVVTISGYVNGVELGAADTTTNLGHFDDILSPNTDIRTLIAIATAAYENPQEIVYCDIYHSQTYHCPGIQFKVPSSVANTTKAVYITATFVHY